MEFQSAFNKGVIVLSSPKAMRKYLTLQRLEKIQTKAGTMHQRVGCLVHSVAAILKRQTVASLLSEYQVCSIVCFCLQTIRTIHAPELPECNSRKKAKTRVQPTWTCLTSVSCLCYLVICLSTIFCGRPTRVYLEYQTHMFFIHPGTETPLPCPSSTEGSKTTDLHCFALH